MKACEAARRFQRPTTYVSIHCSNEDRNGHTGKYHADGVGRQLDRQIDRCGVCTGICKHYDVSVHVCEHERFILMSNFVIVAAVCHQDLCTVI